MNAAQQMFENLDLARVNQLIAERTTESLHLDYISTKGWGPDGTFRKENIAKPISGFSNSDGGVLLYGLSSAKDSRQRDYPTAIDPPPSKPGLKDAIRMVAADGIAPSVLGLEIKEVEDGKAGTLAYAVYVPPSRMRPHICVEHEKFLRRSDDGFHTMDYVHIDLMFRTRIAAEVNTFPLVGVPNDEGVVLTERCIRLKLGNLGNSPAVNLRLAASVSGKQIQIARRPMLSVTGVWSIDRDGDLDPQTTNSWSEMIRSVHAGGDGQISCTYGDLAGSSYEMRIPLVPRIKLNESAIPQRLAVEGSVSLLRNGRVVL